MKNNETQNIQPAWVTKIMNADQQTSAPEASKCAACQNKRLHTAEDWENHPLAGHGYTREQGFSHPELAAAAAATGKKEKQ